MSDLMFEVLKNQPTTVGAFDYLKDPLERNNMRALIRMYDLIPVLAQTILDEMKDRVESKNLYVREIKKDFPKISRWLTEASRRTLERYKDDEVNHDMATVVGEYHLQMKMLDDLSRKILPYISKDTRKIWAENKEFYDLMSAGRIKKFVRKYMSLLSLIESVIDTEDLITYKKEVIDRCIPMGQLEVGQEFYFPYAEHAMDDGGQMFTYLGLFEEDIPGTDNKNICCHYRKLSDNINVVYIEQNALRAVIPICKN